MSSNFFTNHLNNTLFGKFKGIIEHMNNLHSFHAVVGYFRSSGYFKIRKEFENMPNPPKIKILIGINIDNIFRKRNKTLMFLDSEEVCLEAKKQYKEDFVDDIRDAGYYEDIEQGILILADDMASGRVELKIHPTKDLHAKFYLFLPEKHTEHSDGWVIMGSSNLSVAGLGLTEAPRYELNVSMKDYDDVAFCESEFQKLWKDGVEVTFKDIEEYKKTTYLGQNPTPYDLYIKLLVDYFDKLVDDNFTLEIPDGFKELKYQKDAVGQGYQMLIRHNGFFLADVVGLGKTVVATMIAKRFIEENGTRDSRILVIYPPAIEKNWKSTFKDFKIDRFADFVSCGSLDKVLNGKGYHYPESYDLILVDEAHRFRSDTSQMFDDLQRICKSDREYVGRVGDRHKKVMLISATPLNNRPDDLYNLLMLFEDKRKCNIDGIPNLQDYFAPKIAEYKKLLSSKVEKVDVNAVSKLYERIRKDVIDKVTVRRTRSNILKEPDYKKDINDQGIKFPEIEKPRALEYLLSSDLKVLFEDTVNMLVSKLKYSRYKAIENLIDEIRNEKYPNAEATSLSLANIYRTHMVKRLESSFFAFRKSLKTLRNVTQGMVDMFDEDKVIIAPDLKVKELQAKGLSIDEIIELGLKKQEDKKIEFAVYSKDEFKDSFLDNLKEDITILDEYIELWNKVEVDPKIDKFIEYLQGAIFDKKENPTGKLVVFSESKDTINHLCEKLKERLGRSDILAISSEERMRMFETVQANFDANYKGKQKNDYNIIIATDVLAEGVNLHRANVIVNYDTPWNASRLMQRIGRVNRIGSVAGTIVNYMFYPSAEGDNQIRLYKNALAKLQGFHSALGEDSQIYSVEEIVGNFELYNTDIGDDVDKSLALLRELREFKKAYPKDYDRIKTLPVKSRTGRKLSDCKQDGVNSNTTLVYVSSPYKQEFYKVSKDNITDLGFLDAVELFKADKEEKSVDLPKCHYQHVVSAQSKYDTDVTKMLDDSTKSNAKEKDRYYEAAKKFLRDIRRDNKRDVIKEQCDILSKYVELGRYNFLTRQLAKMESKYRKCIKTDVEILHAIENFVEKYHNTNNALKQDEQDITARVVISETFV